LLGGELTPHFGIVFACGFVHLFSVDGRTLFLCEII